jgi:hypothetical protein
MDTTRRPNNEVQDSLIWRAVDNMLQHLLNFGFSEESDEDYISRIINRWDRDTEQVESRCVDENGRTTDTAPLPGVSTSPPRRSQRLKDRESNAKPIPLRPQL